jgi:peroxiredoxin Q/BCP
MAEWLEVGTPAPDFTLKDMDGNAHSLADYRGKTVVLYFYPKDMTPGCTTQACAFRDLNPEFKKLNAVVIGVSADEPERHRKFTEKHGLNYLLLSDPEHEVLEAYGAWREKNLYGKVSLGIVRSTYIIDPDGIIKKVYKRARAKTNAEDVLELLRS